MKNPQPDPGQHPRTQPYASWLIPPAWAWSDYPNTSYGSVQTLSRKDAEHPQLWLPAGGDYRLCEMKQPEKRLGLG